MAGFPLLVVLATAMGLSIFLSLPVVYSRRAQGRWSVGLNAAAIGILLFLLADVFSNVSPIVYPSGYVADPRSSAIFALAVVAAFLALFTVDHVLPKGSGPGPGAARATATVIALGMGLQNLTEGLVFGSNWVAGSVGVLAVVFVGFFLQNVSEGFPIAAPFLGSGELPSRSTILGLYLVGGLPTILGALIGFHWSDRTFLLAFDALAIGAIAYALLPMLRVSFRPLETRELSVRRDRIVYLGVLTGFIIGFLVNAI